MAALIIVSQAVEPEARLTAGRRLIVAAVAPAAAWQTLGTPLALIE